VRTDCPVSLCACVYISECVYTNTHARLSLPMKPLLSISVVQYYVSIFKNVTQNCKSQVNPTHLGKFPEFSF
jgi:hypothetical protein